jgi:predicted DNA-binding transcriptional regulator YafY
MRASRLLSLLLLLQSRGRLTAETLAVELEVSVRTVYRDVESLAAAGVPVYGEPGRDGGYQLLDGYRTRLTGLSAEESRSLALTGLPAAAADLGLAAALAGARLKLQVATPQPHRQQSQSFHDRIHIDAPQWYGEPEQVPCLIPLLDAAVQHRQVRVRYRSWAQTEAVERVLEPYGLVLKAGHWYLVARRSDALPGAGAFRTYRVGKISALEPIGDFDRAPFDLAEHWRRYTADYDTRRFTGTARLRLSPTGRQRLSDLLDPTTVRAASATAEVEDPPDDPTGWTRVDLPIESVANAVSQLLQLGPEVEVLGPPALRDEMAATARALHQLYRSAE